MFVYQSFENTTEYFVEETVSSKYIFILKLRSLNTVFILDNCQVLLL